MIAALVVIELHIPAATSLKSKRGVVRSLLARLRQDLNCSAVELAHQDLWQRTALGVAIAAGSEIGARKVAQQVERLVSREHRVEIVDVLVEIVAPEH